MSVENDSKVSVSNSVDFPHTSGLNPCGDGNMERLLDPKTVKSDEEEKRDFMESPDVKCTEPCIPVSKETNPKPFEFKGSLVITCCPCPESKKCDDCVDCQCEKKKCDCVDCKCDNCQCGPNLTPEVASLLLLRKSEEEFEKKSTECSYLEKMFPCLVPT